MKLLFIQDALVNAGAERSHLEILSCFSKEVDVGLVYFYPKHELKEVYQEAGIRLIFLDIPESYHFGLAIARLVHLIKKEKPDLLVSCLWRADIITRIASWITGVPVVGTLVNDSYAPLAWKDKKGLKYKVVYWLDRWTAGIPVHWIANAQALVVSHVKTLGIDRNKVSVVYRGRVVPGSVSPVASENHTIQSPPWSVSPPTGSLTIAGSSKTAMAIRNFISYGRLLERKGFQDAIQAFSQVLEKYPDCTLTIFGEGPYRNELERLIADLGIQKSVFLPGKIQNPIDGLVNGYCLSDRSVAKSPQTAHCPLSTAQCQLPTANCPPPSAHCQLKTADCFLFPSWYEGFSGALVEAMMAGIPIIASDIPMNLEAVEDQVSAMIFPVQSISVLSHQMLWAIEHPEKMRALGQNARQISEERFGIEKIAKDYEQVLWKVLG